MSKLLSVVALILMLIFAMPVDGGLTSNGTLSSRLVVDDSLPDQLSSLDCTSLSNWQCVETRTGLSLCRANNICVVKADLNSSSFKPKVVIAPNGGRALVSSMASNAGALAAINGDYFSPDGCPDTIPPLNCGEGLTFVDDVDYTRYEFDNWQNRRSLGFNSSYDPNIDRPDPQMSGYRWQTLGAGPQVTFSGEYRWRCWYQPYNTEGDCACQDNTVVINDELFGCSADNWWNRPQSFIGFSEDRNTLYLAKTEPGYNKTIHEMHDVLWVLGARNTLKLDGGSSSGLYFNDGGYQVSWDGQEVANAWVIAPWSPPPPQCDPNSNQIALYVDADYHGQCVVRDVGEYPNPDAIGLPNDSISSIRVGSNAKATLCRDDNYQGTCETFMADDPNLSDNPVGNDQVSSAKVEWRNDCSPSSNQVGLYVDPDYHGQCVVKDIGDYPNPSAIGLPNDSISSIKVGSNVQGVLCEHDNYGGVCESFTDDDPNLSDNPIGNDRVSSMKVRTCAQLPAPTLLSPANSSSTCDNTPTLDWSTVSGATSYRIQADNNSNFSSPEIDMTTTSSEYTRGTALAPSTYYWRVLSTNSCGDSIWSVVWSFDLLSECVSVYVPVVLRGY